MADFDPYYTWLGIPPKDQPPHHYRLLAVELFEENREVIEGAANRQMAYLQELSSGDDHVDEAQRLLGEVAKARVCLLAAESKARYDSKLKEEIEAEAEDEEDQSRDFLPQDFLPQDAGAGDDEEAAGDLPDFGTGATGRASSGPKKTTSRRRSAGRRSGNARKARTASDGESAKATSNPTLKIWLPIAFVALLILIVIVLLIPSGDKGGKTTAKTKKASANNHDASEVEIPDIGKEAPQEKEEPARSPEPPAKKEVKESEAPQTAPAQEPAQKKPDASASPETVPPEEQTPEEQTPEEQTPEEPEQGSDEPSEVELAEQLLQSRGLEEEFNKWILVDLTTAYEEAKNNAVPSASPQQQGSAEFDGLLKQRVQQRQNELMRRVQALNNKGEQTNLSNAEIDEYHRSIGLLKGSGVPIAGVDNIAAIPFAEEEARIRQSLAAERPDLANPTESSGDTSSSIDPAVMGLANTLARTYATLQDDAEVQAALEVVGDTLAEPPEEATLTTSIGSEPPASTDPEQGSVQTPPDNQTGPQNNEIAEGEEPKTPTKPALSYDELLTQLDELNKATKKKFGEFSKGLKKYTSTRKKLLKALNTLTPRLDAIRPQIEKMQDSPTKNEYVKNMNEQLIKPITAYTNQLKSLQKPNPSALEENIKKLDTLLRKIQSREEYADNPRKADAIIKELARYRKVLAAGKRKLEN